MKKRKAFTLLEVLISLSISTFILLGMVQIYSNVMSFISRTQDSMGLSQRVFILFGQLENDISTAFISDFYEPIKPKNVQAGEAKEKEVTDQLPKQSKQEYKYFVGQINEDERERIKGKNWDLFKSLNFINTNPLQVYSQNYPRIVRVKYELLKNKERSTSDINVYSLFRKETLDIKNFDFSSSEGMSVKEKKNIIRKYLVADNLKNFFVEYVVPKEEKKEKNEQPEKKEVEYIKSFVWPSKEVIAKIKDQKEKAKKKTASDQKNKESDKDKKEENYEQLPARVEVYISFWDDNLVNFQSFSCMIPIYSYPRLKEDDNPKDKDSGDKKASPTSKPIEGKAPVKPGQTLKPKPAGRGRL